MALNLLTEQQKKKFQELLQNYPLIITMTHDIIHQGGQAYLVGGAVRDLILNRPIKDCDIEVHNLSFEQLNILLSKYGPVNFVGKSFGILKLYESPIDWSLPRTDASGRKPLVLIDPSLSLRQALERRDLTMNAMALNVTTYELHDPFKGLEDIENKVLRTPNPLFFTEDPLRFFRVMQFIGRFEMMPDETLNRVCKQMSLAAVSIERVEEEMKKLLLFSRRPSEGFRWIKNLDRLAEIFPELGVLSEVPQDKCWHPEGDVFEHTMQTLDAAARFTHISEKEKLILLYAALCHDLGKADTTVIQEDRITSHGHEVEGVKKTRTFLKRIMRNQELINTVCILVRHHMSPILFVTENAKPAAYKRLANKLAPYTNLQMLGLLACADQQGRNAKSHEPLDEKNPLITQFLIKAEQAQVLERHEEPVLHGRDLLDTIPAGPLLGKILQEVYGIQIDEGITDRDQLKKRALALYDSLQR
ncbi:MAG: HD domain-containing protein [Candidatus Babeliaceae bacterium]